MSLLHPGLLPLLGLAAVPVVLHFLLKPKPKKFPFPALRLIKEPEALEQPADEAPAPLAAVSCACWRSSALVLAVVRPSLPAANYSFTPWEWLTLGAVIVAAVLAYQVVMFLWRARQRAGEMGRHDLLYRRTFAAGPGATDGGRRCLPDCWCCGRTVGGSPRRCGPR